MNLFKFIPLFFPLLFVTNFSSGQILVGINGGINWPIFRNEGQPLLYFDHVYRSFPGSPNNSIGLDIKELLPKTKHLNLGFSIDYNPYPFYFSSGDGTNWEHIHYNLRELRFTVYPEFFIGKKIKFFFNIGPYLSVSVNSSYSGTAWQHIDPEYGDITYIVSGILTNFKTIDAGFREGLGISYPVVNDIIVSVEENGSFGVLAINHDVGNVNKWDIGVLVSVAYMIQKKKTKNPK
ncbi:MAG: hypothetical protein ABSD71_10600 [Bacteroidales bacterium]|jgi:hypothetical protein